MNWEDVEYLLRRTYMLNRSFSASLLNRENALNLSSLGSLSKISSESLSYNRKLFQLYSSLYEATGQGTDDAFPEERMMIGDLLTEQGEDFVLNLAKDLKFPATTGAKSTRLTNLATEADLMLEKLQEKLVLESENDEGLTLKNSVKTADYLLAEIYKAYRNDGGDDVMVGNLAQSVKDASLTRSDSCELASGPSVTDPPSIQQPQSTAANNPFMTARQALSRNVNQKAGGGGNASYSSSGYNPAAQTRKILGAKRRFNDPKPSSEPYRDEGRDINTEFSYYNRNNAGSKVPAASTAPSASTTSANSPTDDAPVDERLAGIDPKLIEMIKNEIMHRVDSITWETIAGLEHAKNSIKEIVVWPMLRPDIFKGLRGPPKGLLLFGPPGTGKTLIGKCIASQAKATFFSISASSLTSKWVGEGEKMVRALFAVARCSQPAVIFVDEIDSLLTQRTDGEFEASRRIKTEFLVQFDGAGTNSEDRILLIGATNRPQEIDEAARRRLVKRLYIPLPDSSARATIIKNLVSSQTHCLTEEDIGWICEQTDGYSGSDMDGLCREAAIGPIRSISDILNICTNDVRPINRQDFEEALTQVRASVSSNDLEGYLEWNRQFGSLNVKNA